MVEGKRLEVWMPNGEVNDLWFLPGQILWDLLVGAGYDLPGECGGRGTCGHCWVRAEGELSLPGPDEEAFRRGQGVSPEFRLACRCRVLGPARVFLPPTDSTRFVKSLGRKYGIELEPEVQKLHGSLPPVSREHRETLWDRVARAFPGKLLRLGPESWNRIISEAGREGAFLVGVAIGERLVEVAAGYPVRVLGVALDIGTTTLCAALVDIENGELLSVVTRENPQRVYGADVISRISTVLQDRHALAHLNQMVISAVNSMIEEATGSCGATPLDVYQVVAVGNPVMLHLFTGLDPSGLGQAPFVGIFRHGCSLPAWRLGVHIHRQGQVRILPQIGGFVGADVVAGLLTLDSEDVRTFLYLDIGTNGEMVLCHEGDWWACSAAAGPAFEGGNISSGMRAEPGAVDRVWVERDSIRFNVLGEGPALGFCGSGLIDLVASLRELGYVSPDGVLVSAGDEDANIFVLNQGATPGERKLSISQGDIRQLQLAKAAVRTGVDIMLNTASIDPSDIERVYLAGVFGQYLRPESVLRLGLLPPVRREILLSIGNAAVDGAVKALLSVRKTKEADLLAQRVRHLELASQPGFQETFLKNLNFPD